MEVSLHNNAIFTSNCHVFLRPIKLSLLHYSSSLFVSDKSQQDLSIRFGTQRSSQFSPTLMPIIDSNLVILPEPLIAFVAKSESGCDDIIISSKIQVQNTILCARKKKRRFGSQRSTKLVLESMRFMALRLNILPEPLNVVIREIGGGNGGGFGHWKGFGWGGFDGWRRRKRKLGLFGLLMICSSISLLYKELEIDKFWGFLGFALFGVSLYVCKIGFQDWVLGFCSCLVLVSLGLRREKVQKWVEEFRAYSPFTALVRRKRRKSRRVM